MNTRTGSFLLGLSLALAYILGCATSHVASPAPADAQYAAPGPAPAGAQAWSYQCVEADNQETIMRHATELGQQGWEMVGGTPPARFHGVWCFKRPM